MDRRKNCGWIEGTAEEVICLGFLLDIGDIKEDTGSEYRKHMIYSMYAQEQWERSEEMETELMQLCDSYCTEMERLKAYLTDGATIRVWYSDAPYSRCGFYHLCTDLKKYQNEIRVVKLPEYKVHSDNSTTFYNNWGEVAAEEFAGFLTCERLIGDILGYNQLGVGDWWYAKRIDYLIQSGKIKIIEDSENKYARVICLA